MTQTRMRSRQDSELNTAGEAQTTDAKTPILSLGTSYFTISFLTPGTINPWVAPAIRGLVTKPIKERFCQLSAAEMQQLQQQGLPELDRYCEGCPKNAGCAYGRIFEPDLKIIDGRIRYRMREGLRGITFSTRFPQETDVDPLRDDRVVVRLLGIGPAALQMLPLVTAAIDDFGSRDGLGPDQVRFAVDYDSESTDICHIAASDLVHGNREALNQRVPWLRIVLQAPLSVKISKSNSLRPPTFREIVGEAVRVTTRALREYGDASVLDQIRLDDLFSAAESVATEQTDLQLYEQNRISNRSLEHWRFKGWYGTMIFKNVPAALLPWLVWGGRIGVGDGRNYGAGTWNLGLA